MLHVVVVLDLAAENPIDLDAAVFSRIPEGEEWRVVRLTDFGASRAGVDGTPLEWKPVMAAIERLGAAAKASEHDGVPRRYWITGRAGLPAFFQIGHRIGSWTERVTLINQRKDRAYDVLVLDAPRVADGRRFFRNGHTSASVEHPARVGLVVSARMPVGRSLVEPLLDRGPIFEIQADEFLDATNAGAAAEELQEVVFQIKRAYPDSPGLSVFVAGPATLSFLVGRALNPNAFADVAVSEFRDGAYQLAHSTRRGPPSSRHTLLYLAANPAETTPLRLAEEADALREHVNGDVVDFRPHHAAGALQLLAGLRTLRPSLVHFSGHGSHEGGRSGAATRDIAPIGDAPAEPALLFEGPDGAPQPVDAEALRATFDAMQPRTARIVVLAACHSHALAAGLVSLVECAIGMDGPIGDDAAFSFAVGFYGALADGIAVAAACKQGIAAILLLQNGNDDAQRPRVITADGIDPETFTLPRL